MEFSAVQEVKDLHHDKAVEDEGKMPRIYPKFFKDNFVILFSIDVIHSS